MSYLHIHNHGKNHHSKQTVTVDYDMLNFLEGLINRIPIIRWFESQQQQTRHLLANREWQFGNNNNNQKNIRPAARVGLETTGNKLPIQ